MPKDVDALRVPAASSTEKAGAGYVLCLEVQKYIAHTAMTPLNGGGWKKSRCPYKISRREEDSSDESEQGEMDEDEEEEIPLDMEVHT